MELLTSFGRLILYILGLVEMIPWKIEVCNGRLWKFEEKMYVGGKQIRVIVHVLGVFKVFEGKSFILVYGVSSVFKVEYFKK